MTQYLDISSSLAEQVRARLLLPGAELPSVRVYAAQVGATPSTISRAYGHLAESGVLVVEARRRARVAPEGYLAALRLRHGARVFRLAGSDDPALQVVCRRAAPHVLLTPTRGSFAGLRALAAGDADGAAIHLRHHTGAYNAPFAEALLRGRDPHLLRLWRRAQGLVVPRGNPGRIRRTEDLAGRRVARREPGAGTRVLLDQLLLGAGLDPDAVAGPEFRSHLEVALAVAAGVADAALTVGVIAADLDLDFVPLTWEQFDIVMPGDALGGAEPLLTAARDVRVRALIGSMPGYDLGDAGRVIKLADSPMGSPLS